jgi:hypothetical protein
MMAKKKTSDFEVDCTRGYKWRLLWWIEEEGDVGGVLGEIEELVLAKTAPEDLSDYEVWVATQAVMGSKGRDRDSDGFFWPNEKLARGARKLADDALAKHRADPKAKPWPAWALQAQAAGWTPPKGWTP